jgi:hypothetical protein
METTNRRGRIDMVAQPRFLVCTETLHLGKTLCLNIIGVAQFRCRRYHSLMETDPCDILLPDTGRYHTTWLRYSPS